jgi:hypothetical protein
MPLPTTPINTAIITGFSTLRRITISGSDSAMTLIMKANTVPRAAPFSSRAWITGTIPAALEYMGIPSATAAGTLHQASLPMTPCPHGDSRNNIKPYLADNIHHCRTAGLKPFMPGEAVVRDIGAIGPYCPHPILDIVLHTKPADNPPGSDGNQQSGYQVEDCHFPADEAV